ncbi:NAD-dependent epimerase/dehydratase family protein [uncultured Gammaproteobacteria bacterium]
MMSDSDPRFSRRFFLVGGAGFIGSHFADRLLGDPGIAAVAVYDNFSSGRDWHIAHHLGDPRFSVIRGDVKELARLTAAMTGFEVVIHLASNPDIARAATEPEIDFREGTLLTNNVLEAMRRAGVPRILYASGSGVYGDIGTIEAGENYAPLQPISTYGASKLAGEAMISAYAGMFGLTGCAFRFGNVVGPHQTHGVGLDFLRRLLADGSRLAILGDGAQSKSYIHVNDVINAVLLAHRTVTEPFKVFNVATGDYITVTEIAEIVIDCAGLRRDQVKLAYEGGDRGWKGDVPIVRLDTQRIRSLGWSCRLSSREAIQLSVSELRKDIRAGRL